MTRQLIPVLLLGTGLLLSCTEQVVVERTVHDTVWMEKPPVQIVETKTDTVWQLVSVRDTLVVTQQIVKTDTVFIEKQIQLIDTVYQEVVKTKTVIEVDTVRGVGVEMVKKRTRIGHRGKENTQQV